MKLILFLLIATGAAFSQATGNVTMALFPGTPSGSCQPRQLALDQATGQIYSCNAGAWQAITGGGGGGWNPPSNVAGDTIFGNNTVTTGAPSFFIPGGDVSFSAGNFSVNALHFGPTALSLQNTGIANGNCLQVSGSTVIGGACSTGSGGVSNFSSGNLSPLFTTSVATSTTTPALSFTFSQAPANTMLGNNTASAAVPSWVPIPTGGSGGNATGLQFDGSVFTLGTPAPTNGQVLTISGSTIVGSTPGGGGLTGCTTPTSGNLVCDDSVTGGTGPVGMLSLPYTSTGLPAPPTTAQAAIAANASGQLFWSPGNSTAFTAIGGGGTGVGTATALQFGSGTLNLSTTAPQNNECLAVNGSLIVGTTCGGGGAGGPPTSLQFGSQVVSLSNTAPLSGQYLTFDGANIVGTSGPPMGGVIIVP